uniref:Chemokine interleukin-8-like domain-containing protein n=1 Tax=Amphilophus citrinellus TaxID=61819 RepID=A0A3Q0SIK6_AMPCI
MTMSRPLLLLAALTFCCCITSLHGFSINACHCRRTTLRPVPPQIVKKIEVTPVSGHCCRTEIIPGRGLTVWSLHVLPVPAWVLRVLRLPPTVQTHAVSGVRLPGDSKLPSSQKPSAPFGRGMWTQS